MSRVFLLTGWAACADHVSYGPRAFNTFAEARAAVVELAGAGGWFEKAPGRALRWRDPKRHERGFWEILTVEVEQ